MTKKTILIVEDEPDLLELMSDLLEMESYQILRASSAEEAIALWKKNAAAIDLLLTDLTLPNGVSGVALAKGCEIEKPDLKVLYSSGHSAPTLKNRFALPDNVRFLQKPFQFSTLSQAVADAFTS